MSSKTIGKSKVQPQGADVIPMNQRQVQPWKKDGVDVGGDAGRERERLGGMYAVLNPRLLVVGSPNDSTRSAKHDASDHYSDFVQVDPVVSEF